MLIGAHVPAMGDFRKMSAYAASVGCECVQIFSCSPRSYAVPPVSEKTRAQLAQVREPGADPACPPILVHAGYLINLASDDPEQLEKSRDSFAGEIVRARAIGARALNVHTGSSKELPRGKVAARVARVVAEAREMAEAQAGPQVGELPVVFEDTVGAGATYGTTVEELAAILDELARIGRPDSEAGICIDTCHAWAAGYDVSSHEGWGDLLGRIDAACGLGRLLWIHANDCKFGRGSRKDRHEWIGRGCIGLDGFACMVRCPELAHVDVVVEMPGEMPERDAVNVSLLQRLRDDPEAPVTFDPISEGRHLA